MRYQGKLADPTADYVWIAKCTLGVVIVIAILLLVFFKIIEKRGQ